jgi:ketosteroid isomerase-like protein
MAYDLEANKALVREYFKRWSEVDLDGMCELTEPSGSFWNITFGEDLRMVDWTDRIRKKLPLYKVPPAFKIGVMTAEEDRVAFLADAWSTLTDGRPYNNTYSYHVTVRNGLIVATREYADPRLSDLAFRGGSRMNFAVSP